MVGPDFSELDPAYGMRPELGELARRTGRLLNELSFNQITGAENLLCKAVRRIRSGDEDAATRLVERCAAMPYDPREEGSPGIRGASLLVYTLVDDAFEASAGDDLTWLEVAIATYADVDGPGKSELASVVHGFVLQDAVFDVTPAERRRIRQVFGDAPLEAELGDGPDLTVQERRDIIRSLVAAAVALEERYAATGRRE